MADSNNVENIAGSITAVDGSEVSFDALQQTNFKLLFTKAPFTALFTQEFVLPGVTLPVAPRESPYINFQETGNKLDFDPLNIRFLVDKNLKNYLEIYKWMRSFSTMNNTGVPGKTDSFTVIAGNNKMFQFHEVWPMGLGPITFVANATDVVYIQADLTLNYDWWEPL